MTSVETRYEESRGLIYNTAYKFWLLYGGELDEYSSVGHLAFMKAINTYEEGRVKFTTWLRITIWQQLNDHKDSEWVARKYRATDMKTEVSYPPFLDMLDELDADARELVHIILETPMELQRLIESEGNTMRAVKPALVVHMKEQGWSGARTGRAFKTIKGNL